MNRLDFLHNFQLYNDFTINHEIHSICGIQPFSFVAYRNLQLTLDFQTSINKLISQTLFIHRFQKSWAQASMNFYRGPDNLSC